MAAMSELPIESLLPQLRRTLARTRNVVLQAPPGAGKTTRVPIALLDEPWLAGRKLVMLEPRRLAARAAARYMAHSLGEDVGATVGYRVRMDSKVSTRTRIEVVTEGVLTRMLQNDPALSEYAAVIFDEFHERSLNADLGLALSLEAQAALRDDLRLLVMSATLDGAAVANLLEDASVLTSEGRSFPVAVHYAPPAPHARLEAHTARTVQRVLQHEPGGVLVFLPGVGEIRRTLELLQDRPPPDVLLTPLFGELGAAEQDRAIAPAPAGRRKVVLATAIAETSLTIEGVRVVVDAGFARLPRFDPRSGMARLETLRVSRAAAEQRRGRAGRLEPGVCCRLWRETEVLAEQATPEILAADLAPLALELAQWGVRDPAQLRWLDAPPAAAYAQARDLLRELEALDAAGRITAHGRELLALPLHPRLAHMLVRGRTLGLGVAACDLAALLSERDLLQRGREAPEADIRLRLALLRRDADFAPGSRVSVQQGRIAALRRTADDLRRRLGIAAQDGSLEDAGRLLALAYPDRIAQRRGTGGNRYRLANGKGALLPEHDPLAGAEYLAAAQLDGAAREARIFLAAPLARGVLESGFASRIAQHDAVAWDTQQQAVMARRQRRLGALVLDDRPLPDPDPATVTAALLAGIRQAGLPVLPWTDQLRAWQARVQFLRRIEGTRWPDVGDEHLLATLEDWLAPFLGGMSRLTHLQKLPLQAALHSLLPYELQRGLETHAPTHVAVPSGSRIAVDYSADPPVLAVRLQEMFGMRETPRLAGGRVPVLLHLLSPARRPVQVTRDLAGFWRNTYHEVKKDLRGRYPKHHWPDDPLQAEATRRAKPRKSNRPRQNT